MASCEMPEQLTPNPLHRSSAVAAVCQTCTTLGLGHRGGFLGLLSGARRVSSEAMTPAQVAIPAHLPGKPVSEEVLH